VRQFLKANCDPRAVITDEQATYFGMPLKQRSLVPGENPILGSTRFRNVAPVLDVEMMLRLKEMGIRWAKLSFHPNLTRGGLTMSLCPMEFRRETNHRFWRGAVSLVPSWTSKPKRVNCAICPSQKNCLSNSRMKSTGSR
jgi:hypothetical protein